MEQTTTPIVPALGTPMEGGFFGGVIKICGLTFGLSVAPKDLGEIAPSIWIADYKEVPGARSYNDGLTNTQAMAEAGSDLARLVLDLKINGFNDWYIPSQDELEICHRNLKPTTKENWCYARSGINLSAIPPTRPYTPESPLQTVAEAFRIGGQEAFEEAIYWTSTQHVSDSDGAWYQNFSTGGQDYLTTGSKRRARAVRKFLI